MMLVVLENIILHIFNDIKLRKVAYFVEKNRIFLTAMPLRLAILRHALSPLNMEAIQFLHYNRELWSTQTVPKPL